MKANYDLNGKDDFTDSQITTSTLVKAAKSTSNSYLQISSQISNAFINNSIGGAIHFNVKITEKLAKITYQVSASLIKS